MESTAENVKKSIITQSLNLLKYVNNVDDVTDETFVLKRYANGELTKKNRLD